MNFDKLLDGLIWFLSALAKKKKHKSREREAFTAETQRAEDNTRKNYLFNLRFACLFNQFLCLLATIIFLSVSHHGL